MYSPSIHGHLCVDLFAIKVWLSSHSATAAARCYLFFCAECRSWWPMQSKRERKSVGHTLRILFSNAKTKDDCVNRQSVYTYSPLRYVWNSVELYTSIFFFSFPIAQEATHLSFAHSGFVRAVRSLVKLRIHIGHTQRIRGRGSRWRMGGRGMERESIPFLAFLFFCCCFPMIWLPSVRATFGAKDPDKRTQQSFCRKRKL